ncbi:putative flippase GtrA [Frigoribacterium sp. PvP120]|jgi:putative flippase GtrA|uniref:GtrA family protein n=1 Tax=unclassified Frigoribacterium TaxID=2627005 RepID=UPI001AE5111C|nr:GtrA family protein [Frigoribacterium sp. PvP121]MBP1241283.1 putative flippase GtrA [Frigoribacterium sp. PvP121]
MRRLVEQLLRYGTVGGVGLVVDLGLFNLLRATVLDPEQVSEGAVVAKVVSGVVSIVVVWVGNRLWTFRATRSDRPVREAAEFFAVALGGLAIGLACLVVSHSVLGLRSALADNVSSNVVGLALGTAFRFTLYRAWVFSPRRRGRRRPADTAVAREDRLGSSEPAEARR